MPVRIISPSGVPGEIDESLVQDALAEGYSLEAPEVQQQRDVEEKYGDQNVRATAEGFARGLTAGFSDPLMTKWLDVPAEDIAGRQAANPYLSTAGDVAGVVVPSLLSLGLATPASAVGLAGRAAAGGVSRLVGTGATGLAMRGVQALAPAIAASAVETGLYGAMRTISEDAIDGIDAPKLAEKLFSETASNLLVGGAVGALGPAISGVMGLGLKKLKGSAEGLGDLPGWFQQKARNNAIRAIGGLGPLRSEVGRVPRGRVNDIADELLKEDLVGEGFEALNAARARAGAEMDAAIGPLDAAGPQFDLKAVIGRARDRLKEIRDPSMNALKRQVEDVVNGYEEIATAGPISFKEANEFGTGIERNIDWGKSKVNDRLKKDLGRIIEDEIQAQLPDDAKQAWIEANRKYSLYKPATDWSRTAELRQNNNRSFSLTDYLSIPLGIASAASAGDDNKLTSVGLGLGAALTNRWARTKGSAVLAKSLNALSKSNKPLLRIAQTFQRSVNSVADSNPGAFGEYAPLVLEAASRDPLELLAFHAMTAEADPVYRQTMATAGFPEQTPEEEGEAFGLATGRSVIGQVTDEQDSKLQSAVDSFVGRSGFKSGAPKSMSKSLFLEHASELRGMLQDSNKLAERIDPGGELAAVAPGLAAQLSMTAVRASQFLESKLPLQPQPSVLPWQTPAWTPTDEQMSKYGRYHRAVVSPLSVLEDMRKGAVSQEAVEAIRTVYPSMADEITSRLIGAVHDSGRRLSYQQLVQLSALTGQPLVPSLSKEFVRGFQAVYQQAGQQAQQQQNVPRGAPSKRTVKMPQSGTLSQNLEMTNAPQ